MKAMSIFASLAMCTIILACGTPEASQSDLSGQSNSGGRLSLEKTYDLFVSRDPRLLKARDINFLTYKFRDYSFTSFLVESLGQKPDSMPCELIEISLGERRSLIREIIEQADGSFHVYAADVSCLPPVP